MLCSTGAGNFSECRLGGYFPLFWGYLIYFLGFSSSFVFSGLEIDFELGYFLSFYVIFCSLIYFSAVLLSLLSFLFVGYFGFSAFVPFLSSFLSLGFCYAFSGDLLSLVTFSMDLLSFLGYSLAGLEFLSAAK